MLDPQADTDLIAVCVSSDHARLDSMRELVLDSIEHGTPAVAQIRMSELVCYLRCHLRVEEELLFPILERSCGAEPLAWVLRREHRELEDRLAGMSAALYLADHAAFLDEHRAFVELLENHRCREAHALYPAIDRQLGRAARAELLRHLRVLL